MNTEVSLAEKPSEQFVSLVRKGIECWVEAGRIVAKEIDANPKFVEEVISKEPSISEESIHRFYLIGKGRMIPQLIIDRSPAAARLRRLPISMQQIYTAEPVPLLIHNGNQWETLRVDSKNLTKTQADQVFSTEGVRTEAEQRAHIENKRAQKRIKFATTKEPYTIKGTRVMFNAGVVLESRDLLKILERMT